MDYEIDEVGHRFGTIQTVLVLLLCSTIPGKSKQAMVASHNSNHLFQTDTCTIVYVKYLWNREILHDGVRAICEEFLNVFHFMWEFRRDIIVIYGPQSEQFKLLIVICHKVLFVFTGKFHDDVMVLEYNWCLPFAHKYMHVLTIANVCSAHQTTITPCIVTITFSLLEILLIEIQLVLTVTLPKTILS